MVHDVIRRVHPRTRLGSTLRVLGVRCADPSLLEASPLEVRTARIRAGVANPMGELGAGDLGPGPVLRWDPSMGFGGRLGVVSVVPHPAVSSWTDTAWVRPGVSFLCGGTFWTVRRVGVRNFRRPPDPWIVEVDSLRAVAHPGSGDDRPFTRLDGFRNRLMVRAVPLDEAVTELVMAS
jgi:hypothetical protein